MAAPDTRRRLAVAGVALLGVVAVAQHLGDAWRPPAAEDRVAGVLVVTSGADRGEGSLREALFAAASSPGRTRIVLRTPSIKLRGALPPLVNPAGTVIQAATPGVEIDAREAGTAPVFDVSSPRSQLQGVSIVDAAGTAVLVRAAGFHMQDVRISRSAIGVLAGDAADELLVERSRLADNGIGVRIEAAARAMAVRNNHFASHREAAVWLVRAESTTPASGGQVVVAGNRFERDRRAVVAGNMPVTVERNEVAGARETGIHAVGSGVTIRGNELRDGGGVGILLHAAPGAVVEGNEVSGHRALGMLVRDSARASVHRNRVHGNGYGMAFVLGSGEAASASENAVFGQGFDGIVVIGDSPVVRRNDAINNGRAGLRVLDFVPATGRQVRAMPFLEANRATGNREGDVLHGQYRAEPAGPRR